MANSLANVNGEKLLARLCDVRAKVLVAVLADKITDVQKETLSHWVMLRQKLLSTCWVAYNKRCKPKKLFLYTRLLGVQR